MSPYHIQNILNATSATENQITERVLVPCLDKISMLNDRRFRDVRFTGGRDEQGTDIEYYELIGPDKFRHYTGVQVKKANVSVSAARELINQGYRAFEKVIIDPENGGSYRIHRWIVATTGTISSDAKKQIHQELKRYGSQITFWDGLRLGELILENYYNEFVAIMNVPPEMARISSGQTIMWDPKEPPVLVRDFSSPQWSPIDISAAAPPTASGIYVTVEPVGESRPSIKCTVKSSIDEILVEYYASQFSPIPLRLEPGETSIQAKLIDSNEPVNIFARGYLEFR